MTDTRPAERQKLRIGFRASIITVFIAVVLFVGLTLLYLSFDRVSAITRTAAANSVQCRPVAKQPRVACSVKIV